MDDLEIDRRVTIPASELNESHSRSSGPGGQSVNTTSSRVTLRWNVAESRISEGARTRLLHKLQGRLTTDGELVIHADTHRSQLRNREEARDRLKATVLAALKRPKARRPTSPTRGSQRRRLKSKKRRGESKKLRGRVQDE